MNVKVEFKKKVQGSRCDLFCSPISICLEGLRGTYKTLVRTANLRGQDFTSDPPGILTIQPMMLRSKPKWPLHFLTIHVVFFRLELPIKSRKAIYKFITVIIWKGTYLPCQSLPLPECKLCLTAETIFL
jgi:hypothetical protein